MIVLMILTVVLGLVLVVVVILVEINDRRMAASFCYFTPLSSCLTVTCET